MAFLRKRGKYFTLIDYDPGKRRQITFPLKEKDKAVANELLKKYNAQKQLKLLPVSITSKQEPLKLSDVPDKYFTFKLENERRILSPKTKSIYKDIVKSFIKVCGNNFVDQYSKLDFKKFCNHIETGKTQYGKSYSVNTLANYTRHLFILFTWLVKQNYVPVNIITRTPSQNMEPEPIPAEHLINIFMKLIERRLFKQYLMVKIAYLCALRRSEAIAVHGSDFDKANKIIYVRNIKGKRMDKIPMLTDIEIFVKDYDFPEGPLFNYHHPDSIKSFWTTVNANLGYDYTFHQLRKTRGSDLADAGIDPLFLKEFMRHKDFRTTQKHYIKINRDKMRESMNEKLQNNVIILS